MFLSPNGRMHLLMEAILCTGRKISFALGLLCKGGVLGAFSTERCFPASVNKSLFLLGSVSNRGWLPVKFFLKISSVGLRVKTEMNEAFSPPWSCLRGGWAALLCLNVVHIQPRRAGRESQILRVAPRGSSATDFGPFIQNQSYLGTNSEERTSYNKKAEMCF